MYRERKEVMLCMILVSTMTAVNRSRSHSLGIRATVDYVDRIRIINSSYRVVPLALLNPGPDEATRRWDIVAELERSTVQPSTVPLPLVDNFLRGWILRSSGCVLNMKKAVLQP